MIRLQRPNGKVRRIDLARYKKDLEEAIADGTRYTDGGEEVPDLFLVYGKQIRSFAGLVNAAQVASLAALELEELVKSQQQGAVYTLTCYK